MTRVKIRSGDWVVVLDGRKALFLNNHGDALDPNLVTREVREHADPRNRELHTDRPGRVYQSAASSHSAVEQTDRHDEAERAFIADVSHRLGELAASDPSCRFVVVAPPRALGVIRKSYGPSIGLALEAEIDHDWVHLPIHEIEDRLKDRAA